MMNWYFTVKGIHTHVRVFMNGAFCGILVFRNEEYKALTEIMVRVSFIADDGYNESAKALHRKATP